MPITILAIGVLTFMELFSAGQYAWAYYTLKKHSNDSQKVEIARKVIKVVDWKFAIVMCIKVILENKIGLPASFPAMWFVDMLLMNCAVIELLVKYGFKRSSSSNSSNSKR